MKTASPGSRITLKVSKSAIRRLTAAANARGFGSASEYLNALIARGYRPAAILGHERTGRLVTARDFHRRAF